MSFSRLITLIGLAVTLAGCGTSPMRDKLERVERREQIVLVEKVSVVARSPIGLRWEYVALPGTYEAERKDSQGVYFIGADRSIVEISEVYNNQLRLKVGGVYMPDDTTQSPRLFYVFETDAHTTESLSRYMDDRLILSLSVPGMSPGGAGATIVGDALGGSVIDAIIQSDVGRLIPVAVDLEPTISAKIRAARSASK